ncbi:MAG: two-component system sensor histidine kinase NtrB [Candidatus Kryptoniota bacterium]
MEELVEIVRDNFDLMLDRWVSQISSLPKYVGETQIVFFRTQITELLHCIVDLLSGKGPERLVRFMERIVKPPYNGLLTLMSVHETFLLGEEAIISIVREKMSGQDSIFYYSRQIDACFHEIIYRYVSAYQEFQSELSAARRKVIERQRETLLRFTDAIGSASSYDSALQSAVKVIKEESEAAAVEFFSFDVGSHQLVSKYAVPEQFTFASREYLRAIGDQFALESSARRSFSITQEVYGQRRTIVILPVAAGDSLIGVLLLAYQARPVRSTALTEIQDESLNILLSMADQLGYGLKRFLLEEEVVSKARYISILTENSADAIIGLDNNGRVISWNKGATLIFGYHQDEAVGQPISILLPPEKRLIGDDEVILERIKKEEVIKNFELDCITKSGQRIIISLTGSVMKDEQGFVIGTSLMMRDVTQLKQYELELRQTEKLSFIGQISAGIAHEIGTPLNIILGNAEYLMMDRKAGERDYEELKVIVSETNRIAKLIQQLLDFARPKKMRPKPVELNVEIDNVLQLLKSQIEKSKIMLDLRLQDSLPLIFGDAAQLQEVFVNLIVNAVHSMEGGGELTILTRSVSKPEGDFVQVTITDTGCGIPEENLPKIFNPFFTTKEVGKGTGLGLAIAQRIVSDHKGAISVESTVGKGTTFTLIFPVYNIGVD